MRLASFPFRPISWLWRRFGRSPEKEASASSWPRWRAVRWLRAALIRGVGVPILRVLYHVEVRGREHFREVTGPCLVVSNHNMHLDWAMLLSAMPGRFRRRVMVGAASRDIYGNRVRGFGASLVGNAFPLAKEGSGIRESLEFVTAMLAEGWNVMIYPEGKLTTGGEMQPFLPGIGWLAVRAGVEILPMRVDLLRPGFRDGRWIPFPRGRVRVHVGAPVRVERGTSYAEVAAAMERAVREA
ncbi:MAG: 1-acyl-sn-glycerol-3-phosphate acyltransferase [Chloroflexi bacterium]|nr:1-acyl-sn-glycerol-3-phosphate acyltransferase [Chloroflexota bacterium]